VREQRPRQLGAADQVQVRAVLMLERAQRLERLPCSTVEFAQVSGSVRLVDAT
jgi:hypothetical protein